MTKYNQDFTMVQGEDKTLEITVVGEDGNAKNITGATITWVLAKTVGDTALVTKSTGSGGISITDAANGVFQVTLDGSDTTNYAGVYYHEAEVEDTSGNENTVTVGSIHIKQSAIR